MKKLTAFFFVCLIHYSLLAQYKVRFILKEKTNIHHDTIYISGSFCNWDSTFNPLYKMRSLKPDTKEIVLNLKPGKIEYKFHRGNWSLVEKDFLGFEVPNHTVTITKDTTLYDSVFYWRDQLLLEKWYELSNNPTDTNGVKLYMSLACAYGFGGEEYTNVDSALYYSAKGLLLLRKIKSTQFSSEKRYASYLINSQELSASLMHSIGNYSKALDLRLDNMKLARKENDYSLVIGSIGTIISDYAAMKDYSNELKYCDLLHAKANLDQNRINFHKYSASQAKGEAYFHLNQFDSSLYYARNAYTIANDNNWPAEQARTGQLFGDIYLATNRLGEASAEYHKAIWFAYKGYHFPVLSHIFEGLARLNKQKGKIDSALFYAKSSLEILHHNKAIVQSWGESIGAIEVEISPLVAELYYLNHQPDSAYKYLLLSANLKDSLYNADRLRQFQNITFNESLRQQQQVQEERLKQEQFASRIKFYFFVAGMVAALVVVLLLFRNIRHKQKANALLEVKNNEIDRQRTKAENALAELKSTQTQLIQSEKMASLGELTAGIAHEIQNPLNFVNNFSEINSELVEELKQEAEKGNVEEVKSIANDLKENNQKITFHGKRADSIVKGMLQHSRTSTGKKELTDINALTDEFLRLSYHGLRAKDKSFNAAMETHFDYNIEKIQIIPQDLGRVLLNLFNNAFYSVNEKKKALDGLYEPKIFVSTEKMEGRIQIIVKDNGIGIPQKILDKVYQPFFTTKPAGEGTGLGLSLSYDIITKGHGGELKVETKEGEYALFKIILPIENKK